MIRHLIRSPWSGFQRLAGHFRGPSPSVSLQGIAEQRKQILVHRWFSSNVEEIMACLPFYVKGEVVKGFGRGSRELGIPTANMPESVVDSLPEPLTTGIYFGFSNVDGGTVFKTVLSIGWNPFYHNTKKSLEAHLIHEFPEDFYGSELKLIMLGYIRPETNFDSLESLMKAIHNDIDVSKNELEKPEFQTYLKDSFFKSANSSPNSNDCNGS
ncbi:riboflavin kinase-like [Rhopilema esculentum]|uniref:riboflavin kinase-like n=1 Tax=Rhopilema esculentum TaxID=499914 RepID=UPI0031D8CC0F